MPYAAILNSRQAKTLRGNDPWVIATLAAIRDAVDRGYTVIGSVGLHTWELVTWAAGVSGGRVLVYLPYPYEKNLNLSIAGDDSPVASPSELLLHEFRLPPSRAEFHFQIPSPGPGVRKSGWLDRDREIIGLADMLYAVSIRPGGNMEAMIAETEASKKICRKFQVTYPKNRNHAAVNPAAGRMCGPFPEIPGEYLTHWTRAVNGKWPGETAAEFFHDITESGDDYARSALTTLQRILNEQRLRATTRHIRGGFPMVSFTALGIPEALKLMRWRKRYVQWSFEPYGISIRTEVAESCGIRPVIYGTPADYRQLDAMDRPFFQNRGVRGGDWAPENEWRHLGDLDLRTIPPDALRIIVRSATERPTFGQFSLQQVMAVFD